MKKILSLIGAATLVSAVATPVIACGNKNNKANNDQADVNAIKSKITDVNLTIPFASTKTVAANTTAIKKVLKADNPTLTTADLAKITFSTGSFVPGTANAVTAKITVGSAIAMKVLNITMLTADQEAANAIVAKITNPTFDVPAGTNPNTTNSQTIGLIKTELKTANPTLNASDLQKITFANTTLTTAGVTVQATVTVQSAHATINLTVSIAKTPQQQVAAIKGEITNVDLTVPADTNSSTTNNATLAVIKRALQYVNPTLTNIDLAKITFAAATLTTAGTAVQAIIIVQSARATINLTISLANTNQKNVNAIKNQIANADLTVPPGTNTNTSDTQTIQAIKTALKANNLTLTTSDLAKITFNSVTLTPGSAVSVIATITVGQATSTKILNVTLAQTDQQKANAIKDKITDVHLGIPSASAKTTTANAAAIKRALKSDNNTLTTTDLAKITFSSATFTPGTSLSITTLITVGTAKARKILNVTMIATWTQSRSIPSAAYLFAAPVKIGSTYYLSTYGKGLYTSSDGSTWTQPTSIPTNTNIISAPVKIGNIYYLGTMGKGLYTSSNGSTWTQSTGVGSIPTTAKIFVAPVRIDGKYYLSTDGKGLYTSTNGSTWTQSTSIPTDTKLFVAPFKIDSTYYLGTDGKGLYTSTNGSTWTQSTSIPTIIKIISTPVKIDSTYYLGTVGKGLYTSSNGSTWTQQTGGVPINTKINSAPVKIDNTYYLDTDGKGLYTSSNGSTWTQSTSIPTNARSQHQPVKINRTYYLGTDGKGLYTSSDGSTWTKSTNIPINGNVYAVPVVIDGIYYLSVVDKGLYIRS